MSWKHDRVIIILNFWFGSSYKYLIENDIQ